MTSTQTINMSQHMISKIQNYMLSPKNLMKISNNFLSKEKHLSLISKSTKKVKSKQILVKPNAKYFVPGKTDKLFWLFYIMLHGLKNIISLEKKVFN